MFKNDDPAHEVLLSRPQDNHDYGTTSHEFSEALSELEDKHNMNMSMSSNKPKHVRAQESNGDKHDLISCGHEPVAPKRRRGKSVH